MSRPASRSVLHVINRNQHRGAENVAGNLHVALLGAGIGSSIVALEDSTDDRRDDVDLVLRTPRQVPHLTAWWRLRRIIGRDRPDAVLAHGFASALAVVVATLGLGARRPRVVWHRILRLPRPPDHPVHLLHRFVARRCDAAVCITQHLCEETRALGLRGEVELVPNHRPARTGEPGALPAGVRPPYVLFAGRLVDQKRPDRFVRVAALVARSEPGCRFVVAGMGPLADEVARQVASTPDLAGRVDLLGHVEDPAALLREAACLLLTSDNESSPGIVVEALLQGCPVVTVDVDGVADLLGDGPGTIVGSSSDDALARAVLDELARPTSDADRQAMRAAAQRLTTDRVLGTYLRLLRVDPEDDDAPDAPHLVLVIPNVGVGGLERGTTSLARTALARGLAVSVVTLTDPRVAGSASLAELGSAGVEVRSLGLAGLEVYRRPVRLARAVRRLQRELPPSPRTVVASAILDADLPARLAARSRRLRHVTHLVNTTYAADARPPGPVPAAAFALARLVERCSSPLTHRYIALTRAVEHYAVTDLRIAPERVSVVGRGVDLSRFAPRAGDDLHDPVQVVSLGRLVRQKNHRCTLEAAALLDRGRFSVEIFGEGPDEAALGRLVGSLQLPAHTLRGVTDDAAAVLGSADVFVSVARWEGQSNAVIEAMAAGCLLVLSDIPVLREVAGDTATYVDPEDPSALAAAIAAICDLPPAAVAERRALGRARAASRYDEATLAAEAISVILGSDGAAPPTGPAAQRSAER